MPFCQVGPGSSRALQSPDCASSRGSVAAWLKARSSQSLRITGAHVLFLRTLAVIRVNNEGTVLVDDVEALGCCPDSMFFFFSRLHPCLGWAFRLEDCHRSRVFTLLR